tara:strand:+ start:30049 stop:35007 length:4959 start_codon:yes stop_codon:yes gene_type:complete
MATCPNKSHPDWKKVSREIGDFSTHSLYIKNNNRIPNAQIDLKLPTNPKKGLSNAQVKNVLVRLKAYNKKMGTLHRLNFKQLGQSTLYEYSIIENFNREKFMKSPTEMAAGTVNDIGDFMPPEYQMVSEGDPLLALDLKMQDFFKLIGVDYKIVSEILDDSGKPINAVAKADMLNRVVEVIEGKAGVNTLPEEASHFFVKILKSQNSPLFRAMMDEVVSYELFQDVVDEYSSVYNNDMERLKEEAVGKIIAKIIVAKEVSGEMPTKVARVERWFDKVLRLIKKLFKKPSEDPYLRAALGIINKQVNNIHHARSASLGQVAFYELEDEAPKTDEERVARTIKLFEATTKNIEQVEVPHEEVEKMAKEGESLIGDDSGKSNRYKMLDEDKIIWNRITDRNQATFVKKVGGKEKAEEINKNKDNEVKREGGTHHHNTAQRIMELIANKVGDKDAIFKDSGLTTEQFNTLAKGINRIYLQAKEQQEEINKETGKDGTFTVLTEQIVYDPEGKKGVVHEDTAGTADLVVLYSDNSADIYDYKFTTPSSRDNAVVGYGVGTKLVASPFGPKMDGYNMQISAYKDILMRKYGISKIRKSRIVPIHVQYEQKQVKGVYEITPKVVLLQMDMDSEFLRQIPVAAELFGDKGIDKLITKFSARQKKLEAKLKKVNGEKWSILNAEIMSLQNAIQDLQISGGVGTILANVRNKMVLIKKKLAHKQPLLDDGTPNPDYMEIEEVTDLLESFSLYRTMAEETGEYFKDVLANSNDTERRRLKEVMDKYAGPISRTYDLLREENAARTLELGNAAGIQNNTRNVKELGFFQKLFNTASEFSHPIFQTAWALIDKAQEKTRKLQNTLRDDITEKQDKVAEWAKENNMSIMDAYSMMINPKQGNLWGKHSEAYYKKLEQAQKDNDIVWLKDNFQPKKGYKEKFEQWKKREFTRIEEHNADYQEWDPKTEKYVLIKDRSEQRQRMRTAWLATHDLSLNSAWSNRKSWYHLELKPEKEAGYYSEEYLKIHNEAPLKEFFEFYETTNRKFAEMTGMSIKSNFVANIQEDLIDSIGSGTNSLTFDTTLEGLKISQDQGEHGVRNPVTGELEPSIPMLYQNTITDGTKTKDLGRALYLMGKTAHNFAHKAEIEAPILALGNFIADHPALVEDMQGNAIREATGNLAQKLHSKDTQEVFEQLYLNFYVYGQKIQSSDKNIGGYSMNKMILGAKQYFGAKVLAIAIVPGTAAYLAAKANAYFEGSKGLHYTNKQLNKTHVLYAKQTDVYRAVVHDFQIWQDDVTHRHANDLSASKLVKNVTMDKLYYPYRVADEMIDNNILVAMMQNYGIDANGMPKRLETLPEGTTSMFELAQESMENGGTLSYGALSEQGYRKFRGIAQYVAGSIKGQVSDQDINAVQTTLIGNVMMQFKNWMPRMVRERVGPFRYNNVADTYEMGRYSVIAGEAFQIEEGIMNTVKSVLVSGVKLSAEAVTFGLGYNMKPNEELAKRLLKQFKENNPEDPKIQDLTYNEFLTMRTRQIRAAATELRGILLLAAGLLILGLKGDDEERFYTKYWVTRKLYSSLSRTAMELGFLLNPNDLTTFMKGTIPMASLFTDTLKALNNTQDEVLDSLTGRKDSRDKTPWGYYSLPFLPGYKQVSRWIEVYDQDKVNAYK